MSEFDNISITTDDYVEKLNLSDLSMRPQEVTVPATKETFEAQVVVITQPRKRMEYQYNGMAVISGYQGLLDESRRVISAGKFKVELVMPPMMPGKPALIITEDANE